MPLLSLQQVSKRYTISKNFLSVGKAVLYAVDKVSLEVMSGETLGLVGESGCGKSTLSRLAMGLETPSEGEVFFAGQQISALSKKQMRGLRPQMQIVFQDPATSLNPKMTIGQILSEPFIIHKLDKNRRQLSREVGRLLESVGLSPDIAGRYPHQFSGGQRQRIGIARALALRPRLLLADEPVSALDVSIQAQIMNLLLELKDEFKLTYILIAHDLGVVTHMASRLAIMYLGRIVEIMRPELLAQPDKLHPYSSGLWNSAPSLVPGEQLKLIEGEMPSPLNPPAGCRFHTRCPEARQICLTQAPLLEEKQKEHFCACHFR